MDDEIRVERGTELEVTLTEIPGSGHLWRSAATPDGLAFLDAGYVDDLPPAVGASRRRRFRFRADVPGEFTLVFRLGRPWEPAPERERTVRVVVT